MSSKSEHLRQSGRDCEHESVLEDMIATSRVFLGRLLRTRAELPSYNALFDDYWGTKHVKTARDGLLGRLARASRGRSHWTSTFTVDCRCM